MTEERNELNLELEETVKNDETSALPEEGEKEREAADPAPQSKEENARYAAIRRRAERRAEQKNISFARKNEKAFSDAEGINAPPEGKETEENRAAPEEAERGERIRQAAIHHAVQSRVQAQLDEISRIDPNIRSLEDIAGLPECSRIYELVSKGYELSDAYKLTSFDAALQKNAAAGRQAALNSVAGREHLARSKFVGDGESPVPPEVAREYRMLVPDATDSEIRRHYKGCE